MGNTYWKQFFKLTYRIFNTNCIVMLRLRDFQQFIFMIFPISPHLPPFVERDTTRKLSAVAGRPRSEINVAWKRRSISPAVHETKQQTTSRRSSPKSAKIQAEFSKVVVRSWSRHESWFKAKTCLWHFCPYLFLYFRYKLFQYVHKKICYKLSGTTGGGVRVQLRTRNKTT